MTDHDQESLYHLLESQYLEFLILQLASNNQEFF
jgi:hypothetical protein